MGFKLDVWDYLAFAAIFLLALCFVILSVFILGLPGKIAVARKHPEAEAVNLMGYVGFLGVVPWIQALLWAFKPTQVIDIRNFPKAEQLQITEDLARISGKSEPLAPKAKPGDEPPKGRAA